MDNTVIIPHGLLDVATEHSLDFVCDHPAGRKQVALIMCFRSEAMVMTVRGMELARPGDCIVHSSDFRFFHYSVPGAERGFCNDWVMPEAGVAERWRERVGLPANELLATGIDNLLEPFLLEMRRDLELGGELLAAELEARLFLLLVAIRRAGDNYARLADSLSPSEQRHYPDFLQLRRRLREQCAEAFSLRRLSRSAGLSPERFAALFRRFFGCSPLAYQLDCRIETARRLLLSSSAGVAEVAAACGWNDPYYFSRIFKQRTGCAPSVFRRRLLGRSAGTPSEQFRLKRAGFD